MIESSKVTIIVSRFNENLNWINEFPFNQFKYIVYNKGFNEDFEKNNVIKIVKLENIGRCDHTYLYHIIENYHNLSDIIVFFPGSIDMQDKKKKGIEILKNIINSNFDHAYFHGHYTENLREVFKDFKLDNWISYQFENNNDKLLLKCRIRPYYNWYKYFFGNTNAHWYTFNSIFSIDKRDIIQHPITKYQFIIQPISTHSNPEAGHYIERSWGAIFYPLIHTIKVQE
jgi:hypothetical protein